MLMAFSEHFLNEAEIFFFSNQSMNYLLTVVVYKCNI